MSVDFYDPDGLNGYLANFFYAPFDLGGERWATVEHCYQAQKFSEAPSIRTTIVNAPSPSLAKQIAGEFRHLRRGDWRNVRNAIMCRAVWAKFIQNPYLIQQLLATGQAEIREVIADDIYWGTGADGSGLNQMGKVLMCVRQKLAIRAHE